ncbi:MAG: hypothetical protein ACK46X_02820 [Candidatus Sericytochromatia bacterium]
MALVVGLVAAVAGAAGVLEDLAAAGGPGAIDGQRVLGRLEVVHEGVEVAHPLGRAAVDERGVVARDAHDQVAHEVLVAADRPVARVALDGALSEQGRDVHLGVEVVGGQLEAGLEALHQVEPARPGAVRAGLAGAGLPLGEAEPQAQVGLLDAAEARVAGLDGRDDPLGRERPRGHQGEEVLLELLDAQVAVGHAGRLLPVDDAGVAERAVEGEPVHAHGVGRDEADRQLAAVAVEQPVALGERLGGVTRVEVAEHLEELHGNGGGRGAEGLLVEDLLAGLRVALAIGAGAQRRRETECRQPGEQGHRYVPPSGLYPNPATNQVRKIYGGALNSR